MKFSFYHVLAASSLWSQRYQRCDGGYAANFTNHKSGAGVLPALYGVELGMLVRELLKPAQRVLASNSTARFSLPGSTPNISPNSPSSPVRGPRPPPPGKKSVPRPASPATRATRSSPGPL